MRKNTHSIPFTWLVVSTILKILVNGKDSPIYDMENIFAMFETTNQLYILGYRPFTKADPLVSWDDDIPNIWKNNQNFPNHQPVIHIPMEIPMEIHHRLAPRSSQCRPFVAAPAVAAAPPPQPHRRPWRQAQLPTGDETLW